MPFDLIRLGELAAAVPNAIAAGPFGSNLVGKDYVPSGVPVIRGQNLQGKLIGGEFVFVSEEKALSLKSNTAKPGDVVFTQRGTLGQVSLVPPAPFPKYVVSQSQMKITVDVGKVSPEFVYYATTTTDFIKQVHDNAVAAGVPHINLGTLRQLTIPFPNRDGQDQIVGVLAALDDKITLLRETNATLEAIAQAIFKSWFVDFDPVRAKAEGRDAEGVPTEVADLFPSEFEDSELGVIPKGWQVGTLGEVSTNVRSQARPEEFSDEIPYIGLEHMPRQSIALGEWEPATKVDSAKSRFEKGQLLFGKLRPYFHKVGIAPVDGVCSTDILVIEPKAPGYRAFCVCHFSSKKLVDYATQLSNGAKMPRTSWHDLARYEVPIPTLEIGSAFNSIVEPMIGRIVENTHHVRALGELRDTLLPRLMSGKLRIDGICTW